MIGVVVYRLRAENSARLPVFHGRLVHGAIFSLLRDWSEELSYFIHDELNSKPFTVSTLTEKNKRERREKDFFVEGKREYYLRLTALNSLVLEAMLNPEPHKQIMVGEAVFSLEEVIADGRLQTGIASEEEFILGAEEMPSVSSIHFSFNSPVSFRNYDRDYPFPIPEFIFGSLADKWLQAGMPELFDRAAVKAAAQSLQLGRWRGSSRKVYFAHDRGMMAFTGDFSYSLDRLEPQWQKIFVALAQFAPFSGVGRLTAQGFGQTRIDFKELRQ